MNRTTSHLMHDKTSAAGGGIYRVSHNLKIKDDELPFTNVNVRVKNHVVD